MRCGGRRARRGWAEGLEAAIACGGVSAVAEGSACQGLFSQPLARRERVMVRGGGYARGVTGRRTAGTGLGRSCEALRPRDCGRR